MSMCSDVIDTIMSKLLEPAREILQKDIDNVAKRNSNLIHDFDKKKFAPVKGFMYKNTVFISSEGFDLTYNKINYSLFYKWYDLNPSLYDDFDSSYELYQHLVKNENLLPKLFVGLLRGAKNDYTDIKNRLPDNICELIDLTGARKEPFVVPEHVSPIWLMCKDDLQYFIDMRLLV